MTPDEYRAKRNRWLPGSAGVSTRLVFIAESPPAGGGYFYDLDTPPTALFEAMNACLFRDAAPESRVEALERFRDAGFILVDAVYTPVNRLSPAERSDLLLNGREDLVRDLKGLLGQRWREVPLALIKTNVHTLLAPQKCNAGPGRTVRCIRPISRCF
jgi:hypothetical protein